MGQIPSQYTRGGSVQSPRPRSRIAWTWALRTDRNNLLGRARSSGNELRTNSNAQPMNNSNKFKVRNLNDRTLSLIKNTAQAASESITERLNGRRKENKPKLFNSDRNGDEAYLPKSRQVRNGRPSIVSDATWRRLGIERSVLDPGRSCSEPSLLPDSSPETPEWRPPSRKQSKSRRKDRPKTSSTFGYEIQDLNDFLTKACLDNPANIPVVLALPTLLYQTRVGGFQQEVALPLGMVVNAVFKNRLWLYVQTPHGEEGYVSHGACLPLGILPPEQRCHSSRGARTAPCWEDSCDVFPLPCGNMTDSEKEQVRGGTKSECGHIAYTPRQRRIRSEGETQSICGERSVDHLYLKAAASNPKLSQESVDLAHPLTNKQRSKSSQSSKPKQYENQKHDFVKSGKSYATNSRSIRQTLLAVTQDYCDNSNALVVNKGDVVVLVAVRQGKGEQWFHIRDRCDREGLIPAAAAGHGFL